MPTPYLVVDIGGGSTEFVLGGARPEAAVSVDMGCVRLTERYLTDDPPTPEQVERARAEVERRLDEVAGRSRWSALAPSSPGRHGDDGGGDGDGPAGVRPRPDPPRPHRRGRRARGRRPVADDDPRGAEGAAVHASGPGGL
ncbi:Ppx/GppA phosphatase family protein [Actinopolymorpha singaporensis]|uniref:Ppx/GppA phosphatase family protein n=1 Tax=Actinopolymorpha singaporensis TaxID=117157 RepID=UPI003BB0F9D6